MQTIKLFLAREGGSVERIDKDFPLYQGQYNNVLLNVYVPKEWLSPSFSIYSSNYANIVTPFVAGTAIKIAMRTIERDGTFAESQSHYMRFVKMVDYNGFSYALFERKLPKDFTFYNGTGVQAPVLIINVVNVQYGEITSVTATTTLTQYTVSVTDTTFKQKVPAVSQNYVFKYFAASATITTAGWYLYGELVNLSDYGITLTSTGGSLVDQATITVAVVANNPTILSVATSQSIKVDVLPSANLDVDETVEATEWEELESRVATLELQIADKQDKIDNRLQTTQKDVVLAINELKARDDVQDYNIDDQAQSITSLGNRVQTLEQQITTGEDYIGTYTFSTTLPALPSDAQMLAFVRSVKGATYDLKGGEVVIVIQDTLTAQNHTYKYTYNKPTTTWIHYQIDNIERAGNGIDGLVKGTYGIGATSDTLVSIVDGIITDIYIRKSGSYINIKAQILANDSNITNIINGTIVVDKAYKDENGNNIKNTYQTKSEGATKAYVKDYALPKQFNNVFYLTNSGISETAPSSLEILASKTIGLGETVLFTSYYTVGDFKFQLFARNSMTSYIYTMETGADTFTYKATIYKEDGTTSALTLLGTGTANAVTASASFRSIGIFISFASLQSAIEFQQGDKLKVVYSIVRTASGTATTQVMTALNYFSTLYINMNAESIVAAQVVQGTGDSQIDVMSQDAVTKFGKIASEQITDQALTYDVATGLTISENREQTRENGDTDTYSTDVVVPIAFEGDMSADVNAGGDLLVVKGAEKVTITLITPSQTTGTLSDADYAKLVSKDSNYIELDDNDGHIEKYYLNTNASADGFRQYIHVQDEAGTASIKSFTITISTKSWVVVTSSMGSNLNLENGTGQFSLQQVCTEEGKSNLTNNKSGSTFGRGNKNYAEDGFVTGRSNTLGVNGDNNAGKAGIVAGVENTVLAHSGFSTGVHNTIGQYADTSFALGSYNTINAQYSSAVGRNNTVSGNAEETHILGDFNNIDAQYNIAIGHNLINNRDSVILLGKYNNSNVTMLNNPDFIIANGSDTNRKNALEIDSDCNIAISGDLTIGTNGKFKFKSQYNQLILGTDNIGDTFENVIALGKNCSSLANGAVAIGKNNEVRQWNSCALGYELKVSNAAPEGTVVVGKFNNNTNTNNIFQVGNGTADNARSNAFEIDSSNNAKVGGKLTLGADPVNAMDATTKQYVDNAIATAITTALNTPI